MIWEIVYVILSKEIIVLVHFNIVFLYIGEGAEISAQGNSRNQTFSCAIGPPRGKLAQKKAVFENCYII